MNRFNLLLGRRGFVRFCTILRRLWFSRSHSFLYVRHPNGSSHWSWDGRNWSARDRSSRTLHPCNMLRPNPWYISLCADRYTLDRSPNGSRIVDHPLSMSLLINVTSLKKIIPWHSNILNVIFSLINGTLFVIWCMIFFTIHTLEYLSACGVFMANFWASCTNFVVLTFARHMAKSLTIIAFNRIWYILWYGVIQITNFKRIKNLWSIKG